MRGLSLKSKSVQPPLLAKCSIAPATSVPSLKHQVRVEGKGVPKRFFGTMAHELLSRSFPRQQMDMGWFLLGNVLPKPQKNVLGSR